MTKIQAMMSHRMAVAPSLYGEDCSAGRDAQRPRHDSIVNRRCSAAEDVFVQVCVAELSVRVVLLYERLVLGHLLVRTFEPFWRHGEYFGPVRPGTKWH